MKLRIEIGRYHTLVYGRVVGGLVPDDGKILWSEGGFTVIGSSLKTGTYLDCDDLFLSNDGGIFYYEYELEEEAENAVDFIKRAVRDINKTDSKSGCTEVVE